MNNDKQTPHISEVLTEFINQSLVKYQRYKEFMAKKRFKSLNNPPKHSDLTTLQRLEASRSIRPTIYQPEWLRECKLTKHLKVEQTANNQHLKAEMFDNIVKMKEIGRTIQAIGYNKGVPTLLILERC